MWRKILLFLILVLLGAALWRFVSLPVWSITEVQIRGNAYIPLELFQETLERCQGASILLLTKNTLGLDMPWVRDYTIRRAYFPARVTLEIEPREPWFAVTVDGRSLLLDVEGVRLDQGGVNVPDGEVLRVRPLAGAEDLAYLLNNVLPLGVLLDNVYRRSALELDISNRNNIRVIVDGRLLLRFGQAVDLEQKYAALLSVLTDIRSDLPRIQYIDVSAYRTPAVK